jgi:limonene-1,2-epoxide hydrolase
VYLTRSSYGSMPDPAADRVGRLQAEPFSSRWLGAAVYLSRPPLTSPIHPGLVGGGGSGAAAENDQMMPGSRRARAAARRPATAVRQRPRPYALGAGSAGGGAGLPGRQRPASAAPTPTSAGSTQPWLRRPPGPANQPRPITAQRRQRRSALARPSTSPACAHGSSAGTRPGGGSSTGHTASAAMRSSIWERLQQPVWADRLCAAAGVGRVRGGHQHQAPGTQVAAEVVNTATAVANVAPTAATPTATATSRTQMVRAAAANTRIGVWGVCEVCDERVADARSHIYSRCVLCISRGWLATDSLRCQSQERRPPLQHVFACSVHR